MKTTATGTTMGTKEATRRHTKPRFNQPRKEHTGGN